MEPITVVPINLCSDVISIGYDNGDRQIRDRICRRITPSTTWCRPETITFALYHTRVSLWPWAQPTSPQPRCQSHPSRAFSRTTRACSWTSCHSTMRRHATTAWKRPGYPDPTRVNVPTLIASCRLCDWRPSKTEPPFKDKGPVEAWRLAWGRMAPTGLMMMMVALQPRLSGAVKTAFCPISARTRFLKMSKAVFDHLFSVLFLVSTQFFDFVISQQIMDPFQRYSLRIYFFHLRKWIVRSFFCSFFSWVCHAIRVRVFLSQVFLMKW